ncbi:hypothetical protein [Streptomyces sp. A0592]|uniref:hypothetical protein n=1 Tax=Streptomyces sp. A0592 TaxID=2563099 RepID=UPI0014451984|nr:hypothetical protein [Streptomyces sp. A0592]
MRVPGGGGRLAVRGPAVPPLVRLLLPVLRVLLVVTAMPLGRVVLVRRLVVRPRALRVLVHELRSERS